MEHEFPIILTGPPGAGKSTFVQHYWADACRVDIDLVKGKTHRERTKARNDLARDEAWEVFMTAAPTYANKEYWLTMFPAATLLVLKPDLMICAASCIARGTPRLVVQAQRWYSRYQRHPREIEVERPTGVQSYPVHPKRGLG